MPTSSRIVAVPRGRGWVKLRNTRAFWKVRYFSLKLAKWTDSALGMRNPTIIHFCVSQWRASLQKWISLHQSARIAWIASFCEMWRARNLSAEISKKQDFIGIVAILAVVSFISTQFSTLEHNPGKRAQWWVFFMLISLATAFSLRNELRWLV